MIEYIQFITIKCRKKRKVWEEQSYKNENEFIWKKIRKIRDSELVICSGYLLCDRICSGSDSALAGKLSDIESLRYPAWADMASGNLDIDSAQWIKYPFYIINAVFLLLNWNDFGENMGDIPI